MLQLVCVHGDNFNKRPAENNGRVLHTFFDIGNLAVF
jgi:hypothetical protein